MPDFGSIFVPPPSYEAATDGKLYHANSPPATNITIPNSSHYTTASNDEQRNCVAARLPAYKNARFGRYRAHPYRRPASRKEEQGVDEDMEWEAENISIPDIINSTRYICVTSFGFDPQEQPALMDASFPSQLPDTMSHTERIDFLAARIADIDAATIHVDVYALNALEGRVLDFVLFVRRQLVEQREMALLSTHMNMLF